jgi:hypothetical protein
MERLPDFTDARGELKVTGEQASVPHEKQLINLFLFYQ